MISSSGVRSIRRFAGSRQSGSGRIHAGYGGTHEQHAHIWHASAACTLPDMQGQAVGVARRQVDMFGLRHAKERQEVEIMATSEAYLANGGYPPEWKAIARAVKERAGWQCEWVENGRRCERKQGE